MGWGGRVGFGNKVNIRGPGLDLLLEIAFAFFLLLIVDG